MRTSRVISAVLTSLVCAAAVSAPAIAAPPATPAPQPTTGTGTAYQLGTYDIRMNADCTTGTVTLSGWDNRTQEAQIALVSNQTQMSTGFGPITNGAGSFAIKHTSAGVAPAQALSYHLYINGPQGVTIANYSGLVECSATGSVVAPLSPTVTAQTTCASGAADGKVTVTTTIPAAARSMFGVSHYYHLRKAADATGDWHSWAMVSGQDAATYTFTGVAPGEYIVDLGTLYDGAQEPIMSTASVTVTACSAATKPTTQASASQTTTTQTTTSKTTSAAQPGLANTGGRG